MKRFVWAGMLAVAVAGGLRANENVAAGRPLALVVKKKVQEELKLTPEQVTAVQKLYDEAAGHGKSDFVEALARELKPEQRARLNQISLQVRGGSALVDADVASALGLSLTQVRKIGDVWRNREEDLRQILRISKFKSDTDRRRYIFLRRKGAGEEMLKLITGDQAAELKKLQGKPIDLKGLDS
jgi:hypothetical protein